MKKYKLIALLATITILLFQVELWIFKLHSDAQDRLKEELKSKYESALISLNLMLINNAMKNDAALNEIYDQLKINADDQLALTPENTHILDCKDCDTITTNLDGFTNYQN